MSESRDRRPYVADGTLHIYGAPFWHADVHIAGTPAALEELCEILNLALHSPGTPVSSGTVFPSDGEGFQVKVVALPDQDAFLGLPDHYYDDDCGPWDDAKRAAFFRVFNQNKGVES